ncbi:hypothetical protein V6N13_059663 [Hibiscus sabdariffa]|uniref:Uncharacterized protein n=1 Tax=Hibiscus sabdariffa TaxID=183260 RepID=A0ABR2GDA8_9ROSI
MDFSLGNKKIRYVAHEWLFSSESKKKGNDSFVLSLADVDPQLIMEDESLVWTGNDVVIVLEYQSQNIPLRS